MPQTSFKEITQYKSLYKSLYRIANIVKIEKKNYFNCLRKSSLTIMLKIYGIEVCIRVYIFIRIFFKIIITTFRRKLCSIRVRIRVLTYQKRLFKTAAL